MVNQYYSYRHHIVAVSLTCYFYHSYLNPQSIINHLHA